jgi:hypothetical protein
MGKGKSNVVFEENSAEIGEKSSCQYLKMKDKRLFQDSPKKPFGTADFQVRLSRRFWRIWKSAIQFNSPQSAP